MLVKVLIFVHVLAALTFFMGHGTSVAMAFKVRKETDLTRIRALLDLSASTLMLALIAFVVMGLTGLTMPFMIHIWDRGWLWLSIVLMVGVFGHMGFFNEKGYKILRKKVGLPYMQGTKEFPAEMPAPQEEVLAFIKTLRVEYLVLSGYVIPAIVLALMIFKPF
jgi:hypothetical protein